MEVSGTTVEAQCTTDFRCMQCGFPIKTLYIQYSPGNIRLMKCGNCKAVADGYIECEIMILILDLILHKPKAYRHVFYNLFSKGSVNFESWLLKSILAYLILDVYEMWVFRTEGEGSLPTSTKLLLLLFGKMLSGVIFANLVFLCVLYHASRKFLHATTGFHGWKQILFAVLVSSYFKVFLLAMMVWEFPSSVIVIINLFVISSNIVALKDDQMLGYLYCGACGEVFSQSKQGVSSTNLSHIDASMINAYSVTKRANARQHRNTIHEVFSEDGVLLTNPENICAHIKAYYTSFVLG